MIRAIAAIDDMRGIARRGAIPWDIPRDVRYFKQKTMHETVFMGRATYESFAGQPLSDRRNIVVSRSLSSVEPGFELVKDSEAFLQQADDLWVIGGQSMYEVALKYCDELWLTHVKGDFGCDRFFPLYGSSFLLSTESNVEVENGYSYHFAVYTRRRH